MKSIFKSTVVGCLVLFAFGGFAQKGKQVSTTPNEISEKNAIHEAYDPLIPQLFAFDKDMQVFAGINNVNNSIDIISYKDGVLTRETNYLVDVFQKRHDVHFIYRPQSVAIYNGKIVLLASHRDSCYLAILNSDGTLLDKHTFLGRATAFSYDGNANELYIAGENGLGYDISVISTANGFDHIDWSLNPNLHYQRPKKSEQILNSDPYGAGMTLIAISVVFLGLLLLFLAFKWFGMGLIAMQNRRARRHAIKVAHETGANSTALPTCVTEVSGEEFAAIATAIFMYNSELHDEENTIMTINKVARAYSPWCSKIYFQNQYFNKR